MTKTGLILMISYWTLILGMMFFCFSKVLRRDSNTRRKRKNKKHV